ncbi:MAG TPA: hypothetical protein C5S37_07135 [Methanophagales archaeon]|nr:hypothetical protein [Methanophagales archaeon]
MDLKIAKEIFKDVDVRNKSICELGCGSGVLSFLLLKNGARSASLVDFSSEALRLARDLFKSCDYTLDFVQSDFMELIGDSKKYDVVFSSGVCEHFDGELRKLNVEKHFELSNEYVVIIVPAAPHYNTIRHRKQRVIREYGFQRAFSKKEILDIVSEIDGFEVQSMRRFNPMYGIDLYQLLALDEQFLRKHSTLGKSFNFTVRVLNKIISIFGIYKVLNVILTPFENKLGGLLICVCKRSESG